MSSPLSWPPPGLNDLKGRFRSLTRWAATASVFILAASMGFAAYVPTEFWFRDGGGAQLFMIWGCAGVLIMLGAAFNAWRDVGRATFAVRKGYTWLTIAETMADHTGDTGALISGAREFSAVTPQVRGAMRMARVVSSLALLGAATLPIPVMVCIGWMGFEAPNSLWVLLFVVLAPSFALLAVSAIVKRVERFAFRESRLGHEDELEARDAQKTVVEPWYATFDDASMAQIGRGRRGGATIGWVINSIACAAVALLVASMVPLWMVSVTAPAVFSWQGMRNYSNGTNRLRQYEKLRQYAPPADASISPTQAGDAMHSLSMRGAAAQVAFVKRPAVALQAYPEVPDSLLANGRWRPLNNVWAGAFAAARKGFTAKQHVFFAQLSSVSGAELLHVAASAPRADVAAARYRIPFDSAMSPFAIPADPSIFTLDTLAWAQFGRAALLYAGGKTKDAESVIGDVIALGFRLAEDGVALNDESEGVYLVQVGGSALRAMYATDSTQKSKVLWLDSIMRSNMQSPASPTTIAGGQRAPSLNWGLSPTREKLLNTFTDSTLPRSRRFGLSRAAGMLVCTNMRELLFGPSADLRDALRNARKDLVRSDAEGALFDLNTQSAERAFHSKPGPEGYSLDQVLLLRAAHIAGFVLRNSRIVNCAELGVGARQLPG